MNARHLIAAALLSSLALPALAQKITPGLWEQQMTMKGDAEMDAQMARMKEEMARMPPEQRKMMDDMLKQRGMSVAPGGGGGSQVTARICITPEMAARDEVPQSDANCRTTSQQRSGKTLRFKFACTGERASSGEGEYTFVSDKRTLGRVIVNSAGKGGGAPQRVEMEHNGKWLSADCGDVKPYAAPKK